jgi:hypothetical protein
VYAGIHWQPRIIERVTEIKDTSTKPLVVVTDVGLALVKYMGNRAGLDALICELVGCELANLIGLETPDFALSQIPHIPVPDPFIQVEQGPAFFSRWEQAIPLSPNSKMLKNIRDTSKIALLVVFDTWIRNKDRFSVDYNGEYQNANFDNILFTPDKRKTRLLVIDHTHAFTETTLDDEINHEWVLEREVFGLFDEFKPILNRKDVLSALSTISRIDADTIKTICEDVPRQWGMTSALAQHLSDCLVARANEMQSWLANSIFDQMELNLEGKEA